MLEDGHASFGLIHFWPGNAIKVRTKDKLPLNAWTHVGVTYDGSSRAAGLKLFVNGQPAATEVEKDKLTKEFANRPTARACRSLPQPRIQGRHDRRAEGLQPPAECGGDARTRGRLPNGEW